MPEPLPDIAAYTAPAAYNFSLIVFNTGCCLKTGISKSLTRWSFHVSTGIWISFASGLTDVAGVRCAKAQALVEI